MHIYTHKDKIDIIEDVIIDIVYHGKKIELFWYYLNFSLKVK